MAKKIPSDVIDSIRNEVDITNIIGQYVDLQKRGKNHFGFCPFHDERTPSFSVNSDKQFYHCFSCGRGGNVYNFLMELEGYSFPEAVEKVAELGNVATDFDFSDHHHAEKVSQYQSDQKKIVDIHKELSILYHYILMNTQAGQPALTYLLDRGLSEETLESYEIGLAPEDSQFTYQHLINKGFDPDDLAASGVFSFHGNHVYDRFNSRIIFPLRNEYGDVVGFSGRILPGSKYADDHPDTPKYLNSPETKIFEKSKFLFNLDVAKQEVRKAKEIVLFEGFMDVIAAAETGIHNGVASMGTSLTEEQIHMLNKQTRNILIVYDGDEAGQKATKRAIEKILAQAPKQKVAVVLLPNKLDPDEYIQKFGGDQFAEQLGENRLTIWRFYRFYYQNEFSLTTDKGKLQYIDAMLSEIANIDNEVERELYLQEVAQDTGINVQTLASQLQVEIQQLKQAAKGKTEKWSYDSVAPDASQPAHEGLFNHKKTPLQRSEMQLFHRLLYEPSSWFILQERSPAFHFQTPIMQTLFILLQEFRNQMNADEPLAVDKFLQLLRGEEEQRLFVQIMALDLPQSVSEQEIDDLIYNISTKTDLLTQMADLNREVELAKISNDSVRLNNLNQQRIDILRQIKKRK